MPKIRQHLKRLRHDTSEPIIALEASKFLKEITAVDTGNARNKTKASGRSVFLNYPYAGELIRGKSVKRQSWVVGKYETRADNKDYLNRVARFIENYVRTRFK